MKIVYVKKQRVQHFFSITLVWRMSACCPSHPLFLERTGMFLFQEWKKYGKGMDGVGGWLGGCGVVGVCVFGCLVGGV